MCSYSVKRWCPQRMRYRASVVVVMTNLTRCILAQTPRYVEYGYVKTQYKWRIHLWRKWLVKRVKVTITYIYIYIHMYIYEALDWYGCCIFIYLLYVHCTNVYPRKSSIYYLVNTLSLELFYYAPRSQLYMVSSARFALIPLLSVQQIIQASFTTQPTDPHNE